VTRGGQAEDRDPVEVPIEDRLDLHAFAPRDIPSVVGEYLEQAAARGFREVRLIHGRGTGTQRAVVRRLLRDHPLVASFGDAPPDRGGWGATVVMLKIPPSPPAEIPPSPRSQRGPGGISQRGEEGGFEGQGLPVGGEGSPGDRECVTGIPDERTHRMLKNLLFPRLLKKAQMQGGARCAG
jgi:hypothetical protein